MEISYRGPTYTLSLFQRPRTNAALLEYIKGVICMNQGELAQFSYIASEFHKAMKAAWQSTPQDVSASEESRDALSKYCTRNVARIYKENFKALHLYFDKRHKIKPRICVKVHERKEGNREDVVTELVRDENVPYLSSYPLSANYGFQTVANTGTYYLCNDIPKQVAFGDYINARISRTSARLYKPKAKALRLFGIGRGADDKWKLCWERGNDGTEPSPRSCYRSTLIVPMTLWNNDLSDEYKDLLKVGDVDRIIFGYLCFDHVDINYFDEESDVSIGYVMADLLSLYLINQLVYTDWSETFNLAGGVASK